ncbi:esterase [Paenibacillus sp. CGMCC 1.16610]|uniref:Esterase n=1 Tax=Paenibacillus anseongense TaxID=2682845 RepID=A0ABW9U7U1_9BACL|nr:MULTISPECIES: GDSL-type esterase/lipase family protein [Paenibacillus]MBA2942594.1 esterase [Paenibacillus sp. CGMCC 1.16610]MVQ35408.1 esterase [Paenibacillus anseongense]
MKLVCFGDSITSRTEGYDRPLLTIKLASKLGEEWEVINAGVPGNNTFDAIERIQSDVLSHSPDLVTVLFGANDAAHHKRVQLLDYKRNLTDIVTILSPAKVILISPAPVDEKLQHARTNLVLKEYAEAVKEVSEATGSQFIDFFAKMIWVRHLSELLKGQRNDGLHFGELGYEYLSDEIKKEVLIYERRNGHART